MTFVHHIMTFVHHIMTFVHHIMTFVHHIMTFIDHETAMAFHILTYLLILENNNFSFNESFFNQRKGCTMGAKASPTYATLVLCYLEELMYDRITILDNINLT